MKDFTVSDPVVDKILKERFKDGLPADERVITPEAIFNSELLVPVYSN